MYLVEGCGQGALGANWGDGFATDVALITPGSSNDPTRFFTTVVNAGYKCVFFLYCRGSVVRTTMLVQQGDVQRARMEGGDWRLQLARVVATTARSLRLQVSDPLCLGIGPL